jgi:hypothetical protein
VHIAPADPLRLRASRRTVCDKGCLLAFSEEVFIAPSGHTMN